MIAATILKSLETATKPWAQLYSDSSAVSSAVTFLHIGGLLFAGGLAVASDRATFRAMRRADEDRTRLLIELADSHAWVIGGLVVIFASGLMLALSDVKTFATSAVYWTKMSLVALLLINGSVLQRTEQRLRSVSSVTGSAVPVEPLWKRLRFVAAISIFLWTAIVLAGVILVESS